jgi:hypothetical protein
MCGDGIAADLRGETGSDLSASDSLRSYTNQAWQTLSWMTIDHALSLYWNVRSRVSTPDKHANDRRHQVPRSTSFRTGMRSPTLAVFTSLGCTLPNIEAAAAES